MGDGCPRSSSRFMAYIQYNIQVDSPITEPIDCQKTLGRPDLKIWQYTKANGAIRLKHFQHGSIPSYTASTNQLLNCNWYSLYIVHFCFYKILTMYRYFTYNFIYLKYSLDLAVVKHYLMLTRKNTKLFDNCAFRHQCCHYRDDNKTKRNYKMNLLRHLKVTNKQRQYDSY